MLPQCVIYPAVYLYTKGQSMLCLLLCTAISSVDSGMQSAVKTDKLSMYCELMQIGVCLSELHVESCIYLAVQESKLLEGRPLCWWLEGWEKD